MNEVNFKYKQKGNFTVEFAIIGVVFSLLIVFSADVIMKLSLKGKLDRLSYSVVNMLKERTQFNSENFAVTEDEASALNKIAQQSMHRTSANFDGQRWGMSIEALQFDRSDNPSVLSFSEGEQGVNNRVPIQDLGDLVVITSWGRRATIYRVTLIYKTENWFGSLIGKEFNTVSSSSVMIGR